MQVRIEKLDHFGRGIARVNEKICFIENALPNELIEIRIIKETKKYLLGIVDKFLEKSPYRKVEKCSYIKMCGGCCLQHLSWENENVYKREKIQEIMEKFAGLDRDLVLETVYAEDYFYRNKITLHGKNHQLGYYRKDSNELVEITNCLLMDDRINELIKKLQDMAKTSSIDKVIIRVSNDSRKIMLKLIGEKINVDKANVLADVVIINDECVTKTDKIITEIGNKKFYVSVDSFFQVNKTLTKKLYDEVLDFVQKEKPRRVLDLYCGTGTIGLYISDQVEWVLGIDSSVSGINNANENKRLNQANNITFIQGKVENKIDTIKDDIDLVIVDPPRAGLDPKAIEYIQRINAEFIMYISCDPVTLARDIKELLKKYSVNYIKPFNMFPKTYHVESVTLLQRKN